jgi:hypothetical protein
MASKFTGPIKNARKASGSRQFFNDAPIGLELDVCEYFNDFLVAQDYAAGDWVVTTTEAGGGDATEAIAADEDCGALVLTNDGNDNDSDQLQSAEEFMRLTAGKQTWFEARVKVSDADDVDMFVGLGITDTTPLDTSDRVGFQILEGDASIKCITEKNTTETNTDSGSDAADATYVKLGFHYDGSAAVRFFINRSLCATHTTNIPDDEQLAITLLIVNGAVGNDTLTIDYIYCAQER